MSASIDNDKPMCRPSPSRQSRRTSSVIQVTEGQLPPTYAEAASARLLAKDDSNVPVPRHRDFRHQDWKTRKKFLTSSQQMQSLHPMHMVHRRPLPSQGTVASVSENQTSNSCEVNNTLSVINDKRGLKMAHLNIRTLPGSQNIIT